MVLDRLGAASGLPGADVVEQGIAELEAGQETIQSVLVSIGAPRLTQLGFRLPSPISSPEHRLYELLAAEDADSAHSRYKRADPAARQLRARSRVRRLADSQRIAQFMRELGRSADAEGACYVTGGATAVLYSWRESTIDVDVRLVPETEALLQARQRLTGPRQRRS
jgi:hypothetical protein